jgi:aminoglycoside 2'-N-acetyltransferase I
MAAGVRTLRSEELSPEDVAALRRLLEAAFGSGPERFTDDDWDHAWGGRHFLLEEGRSIIAHASVVPRELHVNDLHLSTGYVEAVAVSPSRQGQGHGTTVMRRVNRYVDRGFQLGGLGGPPEYYERLGWVVWKGPTFVRTDSGLVRTPDDDGAVLVRLTPATPDLDLSAPISCDWRPGDVW